MTWNLTYDSATPPLPDLIEPEQAVGLETVRGPDLLPKGGYVVRLVPRILERFEGILFYEGSLRIEWVEEGRIAGSGDLYFHRWCPWRPHDPPVQMPGFEPSEGVRIYPRELYRYYVRVVSFVIGSESEFALDLEMNRFDAAASSWENESTLTAEMNLREAPDGFPSPSDGLPPRFMTGVVRNPRGTPVADLTMGWVSKFFRRATLEIDRVEASEIPENNGDGVGWKEAFQQVDWELAVDISDVVSEPSDGRWSKSDLHAQMLRWRDSPDLDRIWRYHLLCVRHLEDARFGLLYDAGGADSNDVPREGAAISSHSNFPDEAIWGSLRGTRVGATPSSYFRTAVHEIGHVQSLIHNLGTNGFMSPTSAIAESSGTFPDNIEWEYAPEDARRLRHLPDLWVRPGGLPFARGFSLSPIHPDDAFEEAEGLRLSVAALEDCLPLGAPLRLILELENQTKRPLLVPASLGLASGRVSGRVVGPSGTAYRFSPMVRLLDGERLATLEPGRKRIHSITLLRGPDGALMPGPGRYEVIVEIDWDVRTCRLRTQGQAPFLVMDARDSLHSRAALSILSTPNVMLALVVSTTNPPDGFEAVHEALESPILSPHYELIEAKRLARDPCALVHAARWIREDTRLTGTEIGRMAKLIQGAPRAQRNPAAVRKMVALLQMRIEQVPAEEKVIELVRGL